MLANSYVGMVQPEVPRLIVGRARRYRVGADEIDDLQQQIVPLLAAFRFDPARANGATAATAMTGVIDRRIKAHLRSKRRYQQRVERLQAMAGTPVTQDAAASSRAAHSDTADLRLDLEQTTARLSPRDRAICQCLGDGFTIAAIARRLKCGRDTVARAVQHIRRVFDAAGLRAWIDPNGDGPGRTGVRRELR